MLRDLQIKLNKPVYTMYKAAADMKTGMGVVIDYVNKTVKFPTAETAENIFIVDKERIPTGVNASRGDMSDYEEEFVTVKAGDFVKIPMPEGGERRATDQFAPTGLTEGVAMAVNTNGKWVKAGSGVKSNFVFAGFFNDNGHELAIIDVINNQVAN